LPIKGGLVGVEPAFPVLYVQAGKAVVIRFRNSCARNPASFIFLFSRFSHSLVAIVRARLTTVRKYVHLKVVSQFLGEPAGGLNLVAQLLIHVSGKLAHLIG
jgi:hypothetical protein